MKLKYVLGSLIVTAIAVQAQLATVTVPPATLHGPSAGAGVGYCGKVEYTLTAGEYDSVFVELVISPAAGGTPLELSVVSGDVGVIHIVNPSADEKHEIFFQAASVQNVDYIARVVAAAEVSAMKNAVDGYLASMTKNQKATLCGGNGNFDGLGAGPIPNMLMADGPHGVRGNGSATCFATCAGLACTWDTANAFAQGQAKGEEFRALGRNCSLGPALNLVYHPQGGRASEYYSEDPFLSGRMAAADVMGLQTRGVIATIKHYACNNKEQSRYTMSANMDERSLRELYLYNWQPSVVRANCWGMMSAFNRINGSYAGSNQYTMTTVLREEWGYTFFAMTDWGAGFDNLNAGMQYGSDIDMPRPDTYTIGAVTGQSDAIVDMHARRIINAHWMCGDLGGGYSRTAYGSTLLSAAHVKLVRDVGAAGIILARNNGNILPLPKQGKRIAVTGPFRNQCRLGPGGSSAVAPPTNARITPLQGITNLLAQVGAGASTVQDNNTSAADYIVVFVGVSGETEAADRPNLAVGAPGGDNDAQAALNVTSAKTVVVFTGGSAASAGNWSDADAILIAFYPGQEQGNSIADVLFGNVNPSGRLPVTFPKDATQLPPFNLVNNDLDYPPSDMAHGYFRVNKMEAEPLFNFGHGLSYTTFAYSNVRVYPSRIAAGDIVHVRLTVANTGDVAGKEVVQLYLSMPSTDSDLPVRVQDLRGFKKVSLAPGASTEVDFVLTAEEMRIFNPNGADYNGSGQWEVLSGSYGVRVGTSSQRDLQPTVSGTFSVL